MQEYAYAKAYKSSHMEAYFYKKNMPTYRSTSPATRRSIMVYVFQGLQVLLFGMAEAYPWVYGPTNAYLEDYAQAQTLKSLQILPSTGGIINRHKRIHYIGRQLPLIGGLHTYYWHRPTNAYSRCPQTRKGLSNYPWAQYYLGLL